jgi:hypothetical protein
VRDRALDGEVESPRLPLELRVFRLHRAMVDCSSMVSWSHLGCHVSDNLGLQATSRAQSGTTDATAEFTTFSSSAEQVHGALYKSLTPGARPLWAGGEDAARAVNGSPSFCRQPRACCCESLLKNQQHAVPCASKVLFLVE